MPKDRFTNTLWFDCGALSFAAARAVIHPLLQDLYADIYDTGACANYAGFGGDTTSVFVSYVDWSEPTPRVAVEVPFASSLWNYGGSLIPTEVALVLSFHGTPTPGLSQARRRGRIYIPGVRETWLEQSPAASYPKFSGTTIARVKLAADVLRLGASGAGIEWVVYSPTNQSATPVVAGWIDDSPDTQRRRSVEAVARNPWP